MTQQEAQQLKDQIATEMPEVNVDLQHLKYGKGYTWRMKLYHTQLERSLSIHEVDEWEPIRWAWLPSDVPLDQIGWLQEDEEDDSATVLVG